MTNPKLNQCPYDEAEINLGRLSSCDKNLATQFKRENPETVGETDTCFDYGNYIEFLEARLNALPVSSVEELVGEYATINNDDSLTFDIDSLTEMINKIQSNQTQSTPESNDSVCEWMEPIEALGEGVFETTCETSFILIEGSIKDNEYKYCPKCGKTIQEYNK